MKSFEQVAEEQGWNDYTQVTLLLQFIEKRDLIGSLAVFAEDQADHENDHKPDSEG